MKYNPITAVWEITMMCNMRCKHCGSICENALPDELTTEEALDLCDQIADLGLEYITLSGGEPTTRKDWYKLVARLRKNNVVPNLISNGWMIDEEFAKKAVEAGIGTVAISIDGVKETHDYIRRSGSYEKSMKAYKVLAQHGIWTASITTLNKKNLKELENLKEELINAGVKSWQLQIGLPMGNLSKNSELVIDQSDIDEIINFAYDNLSDNRIRIYFGDCIGYYDFRVKEVMERSLNSQKYIWQGCTAGKRSLGILQNGDILGCTSIREKSYIEGNVRERSLREIWEDNDKFSWNRNLKKEDLKGVCSKCLYGDVCLGGCSNTRLCMEKSIYSENKYCVYNYKVNQQREKVKIFNDINDLYHAALNIIEKKQYQIAEVLMERALQIDDKNVNILNLNGFINFKLGNYKIAREMNERVLQIDSNNVYALKGLGITLSKLGELDKGIKYLKKSMSLTDEKFMDPYYDAALILIERDRYNEAREILIEAKNKSEDFLKINYELYEKLKIS